MGKSNKVAPAGGDVEMSPRPKPQSSERMASRTSSFRSLQDAINSKLRGIREEGDFTLGCSKLFNTRVRFLIMILVLLCLASIWSNILSFNFAVICFIEIPHGLNDTTVESLNETDLEVPGRHATQFTLRERSYLTSVSSFLLDKL
jgi:hypothetical protein